MKKRGLDPVDVLLIITSSLIGIAYTTLVLIQIFFNYG